MAALRLATTVRVDLQRWAEEAWPREACGLLVGRQGASAGAVVRATLARNLRAHERGDRYEVDPVDHLTAWKAAQAEGLEVLGAWHSHPDHDAQPSATDRAESHAGLVYLILAVRAGRAGELRAWSLEDGAFFEVSIDG